MKKITLLLVLFTFMLPFVAQAKSPETMAELMRLLGKDEAAFITCGPKKNMPKGIDLLTEIKRTCWKDGKEGGDSIATVSGETIYYKNGTGTLEARGEIIPFKWRQEGKYIHFESKYTKSKNTLEFGVYLVNADNSDSLFFGMLQNAKNKNFFKKLR